MFEAKDAVAFLKAYDDIVASGGDTHRVADYFAGTEVWSLRKDMQRLADTGLFSQRLAEEVASYHMCLTDETAVEAVHRDISREGARVHYRTFPVIASALRLSQNFADIERNGHCYEDRLKMHYAQATAIVRREPHWRVRDLPVRGMSFKGMCDEVYLCGRQKFVHFGVLEDKLKAFTPEEPCGTLAKWTRLRVDHLQAITKEMTLYSLAEVKNEAIMDIADTNCEVEEAIDKFRAATTRTFFFQVTKGNLKRGKFQKGGMTKAKLRTMSMPVQVQLFETMQDDALTPVVRPEGLPQILDLVDLAPWPVFRLAFRSWAMHDGDRAGTLALTDPSQLAASTSIEDIKNVSALACLEDLFRNGWVLDESKQPVVHTMDTERVFYTQDPVKNKAYLMCLVSLPKVLSDGCDGVASRRPVKYYLGLLRGTAKNMDLALEDDVGAEDLAIQDGEQGAIADTEPQLAIADSAKGTKRKRKQGPRKKVLKENTDVATEISNALIGGPRVREVAPQVPALLDGDPCAGAAESATPLDIFEATDNQMANETIPQGASSSNEGAAATECELVLPLVVEGQCVKMEKQRNVQYYDRIMVKCNNPVHGKRCARKRNLGSGQTNKFGDIEPYAYLGCWLAGSKEHDCFEHPKYDPTEKELKAYIVAKFPAHAKELGLNVES